VRSKNSFVIAYRVFLHICFKAAGKSFSNLPAISSL